MTTDFYYSSPDAKALGNEKLLPILLGFYSNCINYNNQLGVDVELLRSVKTAAPPISKQGNIVAHIQRIHLQAKQLQTKAAQILADAKTEIERMILGE